jgi:D-lactate dehydrogenase
MRGESAEVIFDWFYFQPALNFFMYLVFVESEPSEHDFFIERLAGQKIEFVDDLSEAPREVEVLCIFIRSQIDPAFLDNHSRLKLIVTRSTSHSHIDLPACESRGISVCAIESYGESTIAEHAFALLLAVARRLPEASKAHKQKQFSYREIRGFELHNKTFGVVGTGRIGRRLARLALAFEMTVIAHDIRPVPLQHVKYMSKEELISNADIISLHIPLTPKTVHFLDGHAFSMCRPGVIIINTSGGALIDTEALIQALENGIVAGAGLDSLEEERVVRQEAVGVITDQIVERVRSAPEEGENRREPARLRELRELTRNETLLSRPDVIFTPQTAFNSREAIERVNQRTAEIIEAFLNGAPINQIRKES